MQRIKSVKPDAIFVFLPSGPATYAFVKAYADNGLAAAGIKFLGSGETDETTLAALGDAAIGLYTSYIYSGAHKSDANAKFLAKLEELHKGAVANLASAEAYDGAHLIYEMVKAAGANADGPGSE